MTELDTLQEALGYRFRDSGLLEQALTHRSHGMPHNERLEFLGDSVLNFVVSMLLFREHDEMDEGDLSRVRSNLVKQAALADIARTLSLSGLLRLGEGELKSGGFRRPSILADAVEAILGALLLDGGFPEVSAAIERLYRPILAHIDLRTFGKDAKTLLQEMVQGRGLALPQYTVAGTRGAAHNQTFDVVCEIPSLDLRQQASGSSRRAAEQAAAAQLITAIEALGPARRSGRRHHRQSQLSLPVAVMQEKK
ncbi:MAG: ribonuclease III [Castellaniella sp.]|uniref:ribonuclease III n=1 Tax=Castellaniella sp. TaxID=1955812 RepID=UPI0011FA4664|nr:ribonuclease III [Castellaniella sp.]TAN30262.1 MAG: ribonuclease III [Castellaniella sp.]